MDESRTRPLRRFLSWALIVAIAAIGFLTLAWFVFPQTLDAEEATAADAVVLFAGRIERLATAVDLMELGMAPNLVIPDGEDLNIRLAEDLCDEAEYVVHCPSTDVSNTWGEVRAIARLATQEGWTSLIAVTSTYHARRATFLLQRCFDGDVQVVTPSSGVDLRELPADVLHEWAGLMGGFFLQRDCGL